MRLNKTTILALLVVTMLFAVSPALAAEESGSPLDALGINGGFLLSQLINFGIIFGLLTVFFFPRITNMLDNRAMTIQKGLEDAAAAASARRNAEAEAEKILAAARQEANQIVEAGRTRADELAKQLDSAARADADKIRADARAEAAGYRDQELANLRGQVTRISTAIARQLIGVSLDENRQKALISDFLTKVPASAKNLSGKVEVVSAMPLEAGEQAKVKGDLGISDATFSVDPNILGGLIVRAGDRVIDGSVRSGLADLSGRLN